MKSSTAGSSLLLVAAWHGAGIAVLHRLPLPAVAACESPNGCLCPEHVAAVHPVLCKVHRAERVRKFICKFHLHSMLAMYCACKDHCTSIILFWTGNCSHLSSYRENNDMLTKNWPHLKKRMWLVSCTEVHASHVTLDAAVS